MIGTVLVLCLVGVFAYLEVRASVSRPSPQVPEGDVNVNTGQDCTASSPYRTAPAGSESAPAGSETVPVGSGVRAGKVGRWLSCPFCGSKNVGTKFKVCMAVNAAGCTHFDQPHVKQRCTACGVALGSVFPSETVSGYPWRK